MKVGERRGRGGGEGSKGGGRTDSMIEGMNTRRTYCKEEIEKQGKKGRVIERGKKSSKRRWVRGRGGRKEIWEG